MFLGMFEDVETVGKPETESGKCSQGNSRAAGMPVTFHLTTSIQHSQKPALSCPLTPHNPCSAPLFSLALLAEWSRVNGQAEQERRHRGGVERMRLASSVVWSAIIRPEIADRRKINSCVAYPLPIFPSTQRPRTPGSSRLALCTNSGPARVGAHLSSSVWRWYLLGAGCVFGVAIHEQLEE